MGLLGLGPMGVARVFLSCLGNGFFCFSIYTRTCQLIMCDKIEKDRELEIEIHKRSCESFIIVRLSV